MWWVPVLRFLHSRKWVSGRRRASVLILEEFLKVRRKVFYIHSHRYHIQCSSFLLHKYIFPSSISCLLLGCLSLTLLKVQVFCDGFFRLYYVSYCLLKDISAGYRIPGCWVFLSHYFKDTPLLSPDLHYF